MTTDSGAAAAATADGAAAASGAEPYVDAVSLRGVDEQVYEAVVTLENTGQPATSAALAAATGIEPAELEARLRDLAERRLITRTGSGGGSLYSPAPGLERRAGHGRRAAGRLMTPAERGDQAGQEPGGQTVTAVSGRPEQWFLSAAERGNPATGIDRRHPDDRSWTTGNTVTPLVHGATYFAELLSRVSDMRPGDLLLFTDWRGDPDELLADGGPTVSRLFCEAARRGVTVRGLVWRSHLDRFQFSAAENRHLGEQINAAGGQCLLDMRVRPGGSHHMKLVVLRHRDRPERDVAFVGGIDLCHSRRDDAGHRGDPQRQPFAAEYGPRPPWHDIQARIQGPAVGDAEYVFRERWDDPSPLTRNPLARLHDLVTRVDDGARKLPGQLQDPEPGGTHAVQLLRTYPYRRRPYYFAPDGERSIARGYLKAIPRARSLIYLEDQYLWSAQVAQVLADALRRNDELRLIAVIPALPDQDGRITRPPNLIGRVEALRLLYRAGGARVGIFSLENEGGTPIYVHAKACIVDDDWAIIGSDNFSRRSWSHDSELSCAIFDEGASNGAADGFAATFRARLCREHLGGTPPDAGALTAIFGQFHDAAARLDAWHDGGRAGQRPPGRVRAYATPTMPWWTRRWASVPYRMLFDPDGRPPRMRRAGTF